jgi:hypothetical protein
VLYQEKETERRESPKKKVRIIVFPTIDDYRKREKTIVFFMGKFPSPFYNLLYKQHTYTPSRFVPTNTLSFIEILFFSLRTQSIKFISTIFFSL